MIVPYVYQLVKRARKQGVLVRPLICEGCGHIRATFTHHDDYSKPLEIRWLCHSCHRKWHVLNGPGLNAEIADIPSTCERPKAGRPIHNRSELDSRRKEMLRMKEEGLNYAQIGKEFKMGRERVRQILGNRAMMENVRKQLEERKDEIIALRLQRKTEKEISELVGIKKDYICLTPDLPPRPNAQIHHGTASGYKGHGCRCNKCRAANTKDCFERARRKRNRTVQSLAEPRPAEEAK